MRRARKDQHTKMQDAMVEMYLKGEPLSAEDARKKRTNVVWYGTCERSSSGVVKALCAESDDEFKKTMWDQERKLWGTTRLQNVISLVASGLWCPMGLPESKKEAVAVGAKRIVDAKIAKERERVEREERKEQEEREKRAAEAMEKERQRREKEDASSLFTDRDAQEAWEKYGLKREILDASRTFAWLGPSASSPMIRIHRWFRFTHNREAGPEAVIKKDFEPAYQLYVESLKERYNTTATTAASAAPKRKRQQQKNEETFDDIKKREESRIKEIKDRVEAAKTDEHALALKAITEKNKHIPPRTPPYVRECPSCGVKPLEQFMDCGCRDEHAMKWVVCEACNCIWNEAKMACLCMK